MDPVRSDVAHRPPAAPLPASPPEPDDPADVDGTDEDGTDAVVDGVAVTVLVAVAVGVLSVVPPAEHPDRTPTATRATAPTTNGLLLSCMPTGNHFHRGTSEGVHRDREHTRDRTAQWPSHRPGGPTMAGKHEQIRGESDRSDGVEPRAGAFTDSDIPGEPTVPSNEPVGEFVGSDIPGEDVPTSTGTDGEYVESDIPGEDEPRPSGEVGHYVDSGAGADDTENG